MTSSAPLVFALAEVLVPDASLVVGDVQRRPVRFRTRRQGVVVVDRDRVVDPHACRLGARCSTSFSNANSGECTPTTTNP